MKMLIAIALVFVLAVVVSAQNTPKLEVGKVYAVVLSCSKQFVATDQGFAPIADCYIEYWRILGVGKNGWVRFEDVERGVVWWGNTNQALAITEAEQKPAEPAADRTKV